MDRDCVRCLIVLSAIAASAFAGAQTATRVIRGDVTAVAGANLTVKASPDQDVAIRVPDTVRISMRAPVSLDSIKAGDYVGTTATPQADGTLLASEVHVFAESMRHTGEGHRPMAGPPGSTMTNATVSSVSEARAAPASTMTNATVATVDSSPGARTLKLSYPGGEKTVIVPAGVPVVTTELGDRSALATGAHVIVFATPDADGALSAERISVGKDGSLPPI